MQNSRNTLSAWFRFVKNAVIRQYGSREAGSIASFVMEELTGKKRFEIMMNHQQVLNTETARKIIAVTRELQMGKPVQYVLGKSYFYELPFIVNSHVFIPRPETEELINFVLQDINPGDTIMDIGTGSGCIAVTLAFHAPQSRVYATDISRDAIEVARRNAQKHQVEVSFFQEDIQKTTAGNLPATDIIVSNPPYVLESEKASTAKHILDYEPHKALFVPDDEPLTFYRAIAAFARQHLHKNGAIYLELNENLAPETEALFREKGFHQTQLRKDINQKTRMLKAKIPE